MRITLFDTAVCTENLGDFIIMDSVRDQINKIFPNAMVLHTATHEKVSRPTYHMVKHSDLSFVGGTNLISSNMNKYNQWKVNLIDSLFLKNIILMGVGWWQYQEEANYYTRFLLKSILHQEILHSVRDSYAENMFRKAGFNNVINTSCATMWSFDQQHCAQIPINKAENVVATLTDYNMDAKYDLAFFQVLKKLYHKVYIWPQGSGDMAYAEQLGLSRFTEILSPKLSVYNHLLERDISLDYVGTRLHAGIRALQKNRRTIIIGIDNRAFEKAKDFNIKVCARDQIDDLKMLINRDFTTDIQIPFKNIMRWKRQFE